MSFLIPTALTIAALLLAAHLWTRAKAAEAERMVPQVGDLIPVDGGTIHLQELGNKEARPIVIIHGLSGQLQHATFGLTAELEDDYRLIVVDRPGCGYSTRETVEHGQLPEQARMLWEALDKIGVNRPLLVGHSLGGSVSLAMALQRPEETAGLALLCPATAAQNEVPPVFKGLEIRSGWLRRLLGNTIAVPMAVASRDKILGMVFHPEPIVDDFQVRGGAQLGYRPGAYITASEDLLGYEATMPAQAARYGELTMPRALLYGDADKVLDPQTHGRAMQEYGFDYEELPGLGHMFPLTQPKPTADFIRRVAAQIN